MIQRKGRILVIDDDRDILLTTRVLLKKQFEQVVTISNPREIAQVLKNEWFDVIILDMNFSTGITSGREGINWLKQIMAQSPENHVIMITAYADIDLAVQAMKDGAIDFIVKPWDNNKFIATVHTAMQLSQSKRKISELRLQQETLSRDIASTFPGIIGESLPMKQIMETIDKVAPTDANVLILGENGTGKELVAREVHRRSNRADQLFISVDLGSLSESLFESELFGHEKGAFTDAKDSKPGRFEIAAGGTLFLDEIGNLPPSMQSKLLSVLQNREVYRLGSTRSMPVDIRLISATNMAPEELTLGKKFRQDLLYRIKTVEIKLPPLRERMDDIPLLAEYFVKLYARKYNKGRISVSTKAFRKLKNYAWPGNVRELQHVIERAVILTDHPTLSEEDLLLSPAAKPGQTIVPSNLEDMEKDAIRNALARHHGNLSKTARELGLGRTTLYRKIQKYGL
jgi:two-component system, NtrC family, response regulator HydG